jgi:hypothetical protein
MKVRNVKFKGGGFCGGPVGRLHPEPVENIDRESGLGEQGEEDGIASLQLVVGGKDLPPKLEDCRIWRWRVHIHKPCLVVAFHHQVHGAAPVEPVAMALYKCLWNLASQPTSLISPHEFRGIASTNKQSTQMRRNSCSGQSQKRKQFIISSRIMEENPPYLKDKNTGRGG